MIARHSVRPVYRPNNSRWKVVGMIVLLLFALPVLAQERSKSAKTRTDKRAEDRERYPNLYEQYTIVLPEGEWRSVLYEEEDFKRVARHMRKSLGQVDTEEGSFYYTYLVEGLASDRDDYGYQRMLGTVERWCAEQPKSHFAWLIKGRLLAKYAWDVRGTGFANTVSERAWKFFGEALVASRQSLEKAGELNSKDPEVPHSLMTVALGLGLPRRIKDSYYNQVMELCPHHLYARVQKMTFLMPKWGGTWNELIDYTQECEALSEKYPIAATSVFAAYEELSSKHPDYKRVFRREEFWSDAKKIFERAVAKYPENLILRDDYYYYSYLAQDWAEAAAQSEYLDQRWSGASHWFLLNDYNRQRAYAFATGSKDMTGEEQIRYAQKALEIAPTYYYAHYTLGRNLSRQKRYDEAEPVLLRARELDPTYQYTLFELNTVYHNTHRYEKAIEMADLAFGLDLTEANLRFITKRKKENEYQLRRHSKDKSED